MVAEPLFERGAAGDPRTEARSTWGPARSGWSTSARGGARALRALGSAESARDVVEALLWDRGLDRGFSAGLEAEADDAAVGGARRAAGAPRPRSTSPPSPSTRRRARDFDDAVSAETRGRRHAALDPHRRRRRPRAARWRARRRGAVGAPTSTYVPGAVEPMLPRGAERRRLQPRPGGGAARGDRRDRARRRRRAALGELLPQPDPLRRPPRLRPARRDLRRPRAAAAGRSPSRWRLARRAAAALAARRAASGRSRSSRSSPSSASTPTATWSGARSVPQTEAHRLIEQLMILTNEQVAAAAASSAASRPSTGSTSSPTRSGSSCLVEQLAALGRPDAAAARAALARARPASSRGEASRAGRPRGGAARARPRGVYIARAPLARSRPTTASATSATPGSAAPPTRTSPRRSAATPTWSPTARCCRRSARGRTRPTPGAVREAGWRCSEREREATRDRARRRRRLRRLPARARAVRVGLEAQLRGRGLRGDPRRAPSSASAASSATSTRASCPPGCCEASASS